MGGGGDGRRPDGELEGRLGCRLETDMGTMEIGLYPRDAARTVARFVELVEEGFFDGREFYRVVAGHVVQAGAGENVGRPGVPLEVGRRRHLTGAVGLAREEDPGSGSTEFYICLAPRHHLDGSFAVFGQVLVGFDVLARIGAVEVEERWLGPRRIPYHRPLVPVTIRTVALCGLDPPG